MGWWFDFVYVSALPDFGEMETGSPIYANFPSGKKENNQNEAAVLIVLKTLFRRLILFWKSCALDFFDNCFR